MFAYVPYAENKDLLIFLAIYVKTQIHRYIRINRFIRDFPETLILGGNPTTNLRQVIHDRLKECGKRCNCIRCREVKLDNSNLHKARLTRQNYNSSDGKEVFLSYTSCHHDFCWDPGRFWEIPGTKSYYAKKLILVRKKSALKDY